MRPVKREVTGQAPRGQPGHEKHEQKLVPLEQVSQVVEVVPKKYVGCGHRLKGEAPEPQRYQMTEVEPIAAWVVEYRCHTLVCARCAKRTTTAVATEACHALGERLSALVCLLMEHYHLSQRQVQQMLEQVLGVLLSLGMVPKVSQQMSYTLKTPVQQAEAFVREQTVVKADPMRRLQHPSRWHSIRCAHYPPPM